MDRCIKVAASEMPATSLPSSSLTLSCLFLESSDSKSMAEATKSLEGAVGTMGLTLGSTRVQ